MEKLTDFWLGEANKLRKIPLDTFRQDPTVRYNINSDPRLFDLAVKEIRGFVGTATDDLSGLSVLEIGPGTGDLCTRLLAEGVRRYTVVDHSDMLRLFKYAVGDYELGRRVHAVDVAEIESTEFAQSFDLFLSTNCLSEVPEDYLDYVLQHLASRCSRAWVLDGPALFVSSFVNRLRKYFEDARTYPCPWDQRYDAHVIVGNA